MAESKDADALRGTGHQPTSAEIRSEIERTRAEMDQTFDALERKMTPGQILEEVWYLTRGGTRAGASRLWHIAREHPLPATVIGLGLGWLLVESSRGNGRSSPVLGGRNVSSGRSGRSNLYESSAGYGAYPESYNADYLESLESSEGGVSGRVSSAAGSVRGAAVHAKDTVKDATLHAKDTVTGAAASAGHRVADVAGSVRERASDLSHRTRERASELGDRTRLKATELKHRTRYQARRAQTGFWQMMEENPLAVGVATLALGVLAGLSLPSTRREDDLLGETRDRLIDRLEEAGREALDKGKQVAGTAVETLKNEVENAGLTASGLAEKVREVGRHTEEAVKQEVKSQGLTGAGVSGSQGRTTSGGASTGAGLTTGGVTTPSATAGTTGATGVTGTTGGTGTAGTTDSRERTTPRETITPVEQPELTPKR